MKKSKLDTPHIKQEVFKRLAVGESQRSIAMDVGVDHSRISRFIRREDVKPFLEKEQMRLLEAVPDAVENVMETVREMKHIPKKETKRRELSYKASTDVLKSAGIMPTPEKSQVITNIYQHNNLTLSPMIQEMLRNHQKSIDSFIQFAEEPEKENTP